MTRPGGLILLALGASSALSFAFGRNKILGSGASDEEVTASLPGDELIDVPNLSATRAITIHSGHEAVWPWLAQIGQGRGGFYSYAVLENLVGCNIHNADRIVDEWQHLELGDEVRLAPRAALQVARLEPGKALVLQGGVPVLNKELAFTWAFVLKERPDGTTRLLVRERYGSASRWAALLIEPTEVVSSTFRGREGGPRGASASPRKGGCGERKAAGHCDSPRPSASLSSASSSRGGRGSRSSARSRSM